jgi:hypothetical protein
MQDERTRRADFVAAHIVEQVTDLPEHAAADVPEAVARLRSTINPHASFVEDHLRREQTVDLPALSDQDTDDVRESVERLRGTVTGRP